MRAIVMEEFGGPEVLHLAATVPDPEPGPGQVLIRVEAAGVNAFDGKVRSGAMESVFHTRLPAILGLEVAGRVAAAGPGVDVAPGTRVVAWSRSGYAELAVVDRWVPVPAGLDAVQAAALPVVGEAARRTLRLLDVRPGETLLVHGASGGVGGLATQLAVAAGVTVVGTASAARLERVTGFGALATEYGVGLAERVRALVPHGIDAVLDTSGRAPSPRASSCAAGPNESSPSRTPRRPTWASRSPRAPSRTWTTWPSSSVRSRPASSPCRWPRCSRWPTPLRPTGSSTAAVRAGRSCSSSRNAAQVVRHRGRPAGLSPRTTTLPDGLAGHLRARTRSK